MKNLNIKNWRVQKVLRKQVVFFNSFLRNAETTAKKAEQKKQKNRKMKLKRNEKKNKIKKKNIHDILDKFNDKQNEEKYINHVKTSTKRIKNQLDKSINEILKIPLAIPHFTEVIPQGLEPIGVGRFGQVGLYKIPSLNIIVAGKSCHEASRKEFLSEAILLSQVNGSVFFPYFFGMSNDLILMEFIGPSLGDFSKTKTTMDKINYYSIARSVIEGVIFLHSKKILHNDLHCNKICLRKSNMAMAVIIDLGKSSLESSSLKYNITKATTQRRYVTKHPHIAYELVFLGSMQSRKTDTYSV